MCAPFKKTINSLNAKVVSLIDYLKLQVIFLLQSTTFWPLNKREKRSHNMAIQSEKNQFVNERDCWMLDFADQTQIGAGKRWILLIISHSLCHLCKSMCSRLKYLRFLVFSHAIHFKSLRYLTISVVCLLVALFINFLFTL